MSAPLVLIYNLNAEKAGALRVLCLKLGVRMRSVKAAEYAEPVGALAGVAEPTGAAFAGEAFGDEMLVMVNFSEKLFNSLLQGLRTARIFIPLKAVLTPTNARWDSIQLHAELAEEHARMKNQ